MKGYGKQILFTGLYLIMLSFLLVLQYCYIDGMIPKLLASGIALLLTFPCLILMRRWKDAVLTNNDGEEPEAGREPVWKDFLGCLSEYSLTKREAEVAWLIYRKYTNAQIGEELFISETTVKKHAGHIYEKMSVNGRNELIKAIDDKWEELS